MKVLFGVPLRRTTGFFEKFLRLMGLDWGVPSYNTSSRTLKSLPVGIPYRGFHGPMHLRADSTGVNTEAEGEWHSRVQSSHKWRLLLTRQPTILRA